MILPYFLCFFFSLSCLFASEQKALVPYEKGLLQKKLAEKKSIVSILNENKQKEGVLVAKFLHHYELSKQQLEQEKKYELYLRELRNSVHVDGVYQDIMNGRDRYRFSHVDPVVRSFCFELCKADAALDKPQTFYTQYWQNYFGKHREDLRQYIEGKVDCDIQSIVSSVHELSEQIADVTNVKKEIQSSMDLMRDESYLLQERLNLLTHESEGVAQRILASAFLNYKDRKKAQELLRVKDHAASVIQVGCRKFIARKNYEKQQALQAYELKKQEEEKVKKLLIEAKKEQQRSENKAREDKIKADAMLAKQQKRKDLKDRKKQSKKSLLVSQPSQCITDQDLAFLDQEIAKNLQEKNQQLVTKDTLGLTSLDKKIDEPEESIFLPVAAQSQPLIFEATFEDACTTLMPNMRRRRMYLMESFKNLKVSSVNDLHKCIAMLDDQNDFFKVKYMSSADIACSLGAILTDLVALPTDHQETIILWDDFFVKTIMGNSELWTKHAIPLCSQIPEQAKTLRRFQELFSDLSERCQDQTIQSIQESLGLLKTELKDVQDQIAVLKQDAKKNDKDVKKATKRITDLENQIIKKEKLLSYKLHHYVMSKVHDVLFFQPDLNSFHKLTSEELQSRKKLIDESFGFVSVADISQDEIRQFLSAMYHPLVEDFLVLATQVHKDDFVESLIAGTLDVVAQKGPEIIPDRFYQSLLDRFVHNHLKAGQGYEKDSLADFVRLYGYTVQKMRMSSFAHATESVVESKDDFVK